MKTCKKCGIEKAESEYYRSGKLRQWSRLVCKVCDTQTTRAWYRKNSNPDRKARWNEAAKTRRERIKDAVFGAYGGYVCVCCGENERSFLTLDHIGNDGAKWRLETFGSRSMAGYRTYWHLFRNSFPAGFQVLCMNCNFGKRMNSGTCPHLAKSNDHPLVGVGSSDPKRNASALRLVSGDDMVSPAMKVAAGQDMTFLHGRRFAAYAEGKQ